MGRSVCAVLGCSSSKFGASSTSFFKIYAGDRAVESWIEFCRNPSITKNSIICSKHFRQSDFYNPKNKSQGLYLHARPSLFPAILGEGHEDMQFIDVDTAPLPEVPQPNSDNILYSSDEMEVAGEVEIGAWPESSEVLCEVPYSSKSRSNARKINDLIAHDHDYCMDADRVVKTMEYCIKVEKENVELKKKLKTKQKHASKLKARMRILKSEAKRSKSLLARQTSELYDPILLELQRNKKRKLRGARYSDQMRNMSIILHYCSTKAYRQMRKYFTLPSIGTIKRWLSKLEVKEGFSTTVLNLLKFKAAGLPEDEKLVTIFIDEMSVAQRLSYCANAKIDYFTGFATKVGKEEINVKQRASSALVIMIKSIKSGFKQAIGYFFNTSSVTTARLQTIVEEGIKRVKETGLIPKLLVCDQNSSNRSLFRTYGVTVERPWFVFNGTKIFCAYDAPHFVKSSRNNLLRHNAVFDGKICSFKHIVDLYNEDTKYIPRAVPRLTYNHIELAPFAEMRVSLATQTLSESVSAGLKTYVHTKKLPSECLNTAAYCEQFDKLFDCANSSTFNETKDLKRPLQEKSAHWPFLKDMKEKLVSLKFIPKECFDLKKETEFAKLPAQSRRPYFVDGWLLYIAAVEELWKDVHVNHGLTFLRTRNLSQDCLEHFFSIIRWKNCNNNHPDPSKFASAYKSIVVNQLIAPKKLGNVEADLNKYFVSTSEMAKVRIIEDSKPKSMQVNETNVKMNVSQANTVHYTSGWVTTKLKHAECIERMQADDQKVPREAAVLLNFKKFKPTFKLYSPGLKIFKLCKKIVSVFEKNFEPFLKQSVLGVKRRLINLIFWSYKSDCSEQLVYNVLCVSCAKLIADKYINMLIKAKLQIMNTNSRVTDQIKRKVTKDKKIQAKRRKLNINT